jgi:hypothetical protein
MPLNMADAQKVAADNLVDPKQAGQETAPATTGDAPHDSPQAAAGAGDLQATALNGAQITALLQITAEVAAGDLAPEAGKALIAVAFPLMPQAKIAAIVDAIEIKEKQPVPPQLQPAPQPGESPAENLDLKEKAGKVVDDVMQRMIHLEGIAARQAAKKPGEFLKWLDAFYPEHEVRCQAALLPAAELLAALGDERKLPATIAFDVAKRNSEKHREELLAAAGCQADELPAAITNLVSLWERKVA